MNYYYTHNYKDSKINSIQIKLASENSIIKWGSRKLPNGNIIGEIKTAQTMNYKTLKPENEGLFCEKVFGPIKDFECACGKKYENEFVGFCAQCGIEFISSQVRRNRLGYIKLVSPVVHTWYVKYISILLDISNKSIDSIIYCTDEILFKNNIKKKLLQNSNDLINVSDITHNPYKSEINNLIYSFHLQKNIFSYFKSLKKAIFVTQSQSCFDNYNNFDSLYYALNNFYSISYHFQWEAKKQWNIIVWYLKYKQIKQNSFHKVYMSELHTNDTLTLNYENKFLFGTKIIYNWLRFFDYNFQLSNLERQLRFHIFEIKEEIKELAGIIFIYFFESKSFASIQKRIKRLHWQKNKQFRRLKLIMHFRQAKIQPKWMILSVLPVLPPDLRPIVELGSNKVAVSDLNKSYQTILLRNLRLKKFYNNVSFNNFTEEVRYTKRLLQESVDELIYQSKSNKKTTTAVKSLSSILKGKRGRFRQNLLGKRVDYSGRSVIVVDPKLKLHECGIPLKMAIELFHPFLIKYLILNKFVKTIPGAKQLIQTHNTTILSAVRSVLTNYLVLLNRAPTLHKLGIQAFQPKLVTGKAICLHPLVCPAFNADFDGDQMGLHIPLSFESQAEAWKLLWSRNNLLLSAMGTPVLTPGQDVVLGCYYLTSLLTPSSSGYAIRSKKFLNDSRNYLYFKNFKDVLKAYYQEKIDIHTEIWINCIDNFLSESKNPYLKSIKICKNGQICYKYENYEFYYNSQGYQINQFIKTTVGRVIFNNFIQTILF